MTIRNNEIADAVVRTLEQYFRDLDGNKMSFVYFGITTSS